MRLAILTMMVLGTVLTASDSRAQNSHWNDWARRQGFGYSDGYHVGSRCGTCGSSWEPAFIPMTPQPTPAAQQNAWVPNPAAVYPGMMPASAMMPPQVPQPMMPVAYVGYPSQPLAAAPAGPSSNLPAPGYAPGYSAGYPQAYPTMQAYAAPQMSVAGPSYGGAAPMWTAAMPTPTWAGQTHAAPVSFSPSYGPVQPWTQRNSSATLPSGPPYPVTDSPLVTLTPRPLPDPTPQAAMPQAAMRSPSYVPAPVNYGMPMGAYPTPMILMAPPAGYGGPSWYGNAPLMRLP